MDVNSHRQRMEDIQKRKAERRKKQIFKNRCIALVFCLLVLFLVVFGISRCTSNMIKQVTPTPAPTFTPIPKDSSGIAQAFFEDSAFVGNSFIDGMIIYDLVDGADYFSKVGLNVKTASTDSTDTGSCPVIEELNSTKVYKKIFMMFGENEVDWPSTQTFTDEYTKLVKKAKQYQPEAEIYLLAITPITKEASDAEQDGATNEKIKKFNKLIKQVADSENVTYCDLFTAVADKNGELPKEAATDGVHFGNEYYKKCLIYIQEHYSDGAVEKESSDNSDSSSSSQSSSSSGSSSSSSSSSSGKSSSQSSSSEKSTSGSTSSGTSSSSSGNSQSSSTNKSSSSGTSSGSSSAGSANKSSQSSTSQSSGSSSSSSGSTSSSSQSSSGNAAPAKSLDD